MIKHKKVSAIADTADAALVQPSDWNGEHALANWSVVTLGLSKFTISGSTIQFPQQRGHYSVSDAVTRTAAGNYRIPVNIAMYSAAELGNPDMTISLFAFLSARPRGVLTAGYYFMAVGDDADGSVRVKLQNSSDVGVDPNVVVDIEVMIFGRVLPN